MKLYGHGKTDELYENPLPVPPCQMKIQNGLDFYTRNLPKYCLSKLGVS